MSALWVLVDDTSPDIKYTGSSWFADVGSQDFKGDFGTPYHSTLHGTKSSASLAFSFSGPAVMVSGTLLLRSDAGVFDPKWECFVDGQSIGSNTLLSTTPENNNNICGPKFDLGDGPHTVTVNVTVAKGQTFWFDKIQYMPSASVAMSNAAVLLDAGYPSLPFGNGWADLKSVGVPVKFTTQEGGSFDYDFSGTSLAWYGVIPKELPGSAASATYSIDGGQPQSFTLNGHQPNEQNTLYHQKFFETSVYPMGKHRLSVVFKGNSETTPLTLNYLVVQSGQSSTTPTSPQNSTPGSQASTAGSQASIPGSAASTLASAPSGAATLPGNAASTGVARNAHSSSVGPIVGGVIGAIAAIAILVFIAFLVFRRRRRRIQLSEPLPTGPVQLNNTFVDSFHPAPSQASLVSPGGQDRLSPNRFSPYTSASPATQPGYLPHVEYVPYNPTTTKGREVAEVSSFTSSGPRSLVTQSTSAQPRSDNSSSSNSHLRDQDSGLRLGNPAPVRLPPEYTRE